MIKLMVDFGDEVGKRTIFAGLMKHYKPEDLMGKQFPFVVNMAPKKIGPEGGVSEGMMLAAGVPVQGGKEGEEEPVLLKVSRKVPNGTKVR